MGSSPLGFLLLLSSLSPEADGVSLPKVGSAAETAANPPTVHIQEELGSQEGAECSHVRV